MSLLYVLGTSLQLTARLTGPTTPARHRGSHSTYSNNSLTCGNSAKTLKDSRINTCCLYYYLSLFGVRTLWTFLQILTTGSNNIHLIIRNSSRLDFNHQNILQCIMVDSLAIEILCKFNVIMCGPGIDGSIQCTQIQGTETSQSQSSSWG